MANIRKNGKIEILRLYFCLSVVLYHASGDVIEDANFIRPGITFFAHGRTAVEFFFLLSGFLMAKSAYKYKNSKTSIGKDTFDFVYKKIARIFPIHIMACILVVIVMAFNTESADFWNMMGDSLPSWFFLQRTGLYSNDIITIEWYICSMLLALAIIYPLLRKHFDAMAYVVAPVVSSLMIGYMIHEYGVMPGFKAWETYIYACNLRGFAVVLLGVFVFVISEKIKEKDFSKGQWIWLIILENAAWVYSCYFVFSNMDPDKEGIFVYITALAMAISFARDYKFKLYNSKFASYLGRISLPIYLCQNFPRRLVYYYGQELSKKESLFWILFGSIVVGILIDLLEQGRQKLVAKKHLTNK